MNKNGVKILVAACLSTMAASAAFGDAAVPFHYDLTSTLTNPPVKDFVTTSLAADIQLATTEANSLSGLDLSTDHVQIHLKDSITLVVNGASYSQGQNGDYVHKGAVKSLNLVMEPDFSNHPVERFRSIFFHEFGHYLHEYYLSRTSSYGEYRAILDQGPSHEISPQENIKEDLLAAYSGIFSPYAELAADVFRVMALNEPGTYASRDLSKMSLDIDESADQDAHNLFNPVRAYIWQKKLAGNLDNEDLKAKIWSTLMETSSRTIQAQYEQAKAKIQANPNIDDSDLGLPSMRQKNQELLDALQGI